jgi:hypothetical protein
MRCGASHESGPTARGFAEPPGGETCVRVKVLGSLDGVLLLGFALLPLVVQDSNRHSVVGDQRSKTHAGNAN